jgi:ribose/xylose/arabinose/galactoside ABC-type transport system permease subunit
MTNADTGVTPDRNAAEAASGAHERLVRRTLIESSVTAFAFILLVVGFAVWLGGTFFQVDGRLLNVHQNAPILLLSLSALVTITPGMFDLSIAGVATLTVFTTIGFTINDGLPLPLTLIITVGIGMAIGMINAFLVEWLRVNPFIATLGTGSIAAGIGTVYSGGVVISPGAGGHPVPDWFVAFGRFGNKAPAWLILVFVLAVGAALLTGVDRLHPAAWSRKRWLSVKFTAVVLIVVPIVVIFPVWQWMSDVSWMILVLLAAASTLWVLMEHTTFGRHLQAIGSNRSAALLAGVNVRRQVTKSFLLSGAISAVAGICLAALSGAAEPDAAASFLLPAFASVFLSTVVLSHGKFTVPGTIVSGVFVVWIGLGLVIGGVSAQWIPIVNGAILIGAVAMSTAVRRADR